MTHSSTSLKILSLSLCVMAMSVDSGICQQKPEQVNLQFVTFPKWTTRQPIEMAIGEGETLEIIAPSNSFSKPYQAPKLSSWVFGRTITNEKGDSAFETFGQGNSLDSKNQLILLILLGKEPSDGLKVIVLDAQLSNFGGGEFFYYNASTFDVGGMMGKSKFVLKPGDTKIIKPTPQDIDTREGISFVQSVNFYRKGDVSNPLYNSTWHLNPKVRSMIFFYQDNDKKRLKMHTLQDFLP